MNQLSSVQDNFEFLPHTDITMAGIQDWMAMIYDESFERIDMYTNPPLMAEYIPTRFMVIDWAFGLFDELKFEFAVNGHAQEYMEDIEDMRANGLSDGDIIESWADERSYNSSYIGPMPENCMEAMLMRDVNRGLNLYHMSYLLDSHELKDNPYCSPDNLIVKEWINCPIVQVW